MVNGIFDKQIWRDEKTGETRFSIQPDVDGTDPDVLPFVHAGILYCHGTCASFGKGIPLTLNGKIGRDGTFEVSDAHVGIYGEKNIEKMIRFLIPRAELPGIEKTKRIITEYIESIPAENHTGLAAARRDDQYSIKTVFDAFSNKTVSEKIIDAVGIHYWKVCCGKLKKLKSHDRLVHFLSLLGISYDRIYSMEEDGVELADICKNPYMTFLPYDIGIQAADEAARRIYHVSAYDKKRISGFVHYAMQNHEKNGSTCISYSDLLNHVNYYLRTSFYPDKEISKTMMLTAILSDESLSHVFQEGDQKIYIVKTKTADKEKRIAKNITRLNNAGGYESMVQLSCEQLSSIEQELGIHYNDGQRNAFSCLSSPGVKIITGPPGSGKTMLVKGLIKGYRMIKENAAVQLCATTGRAANVLAKSCGVPASTIHKALDIRPFEGGFSSRSERNPLPADFVVCDEISMIGLDIACALLNAVKTGSTLLLVGDKDQLQSVDPGNVLYDLISSGVIETYHLTEVVRQGGMLQENALRIRNGDKYLPQGRHFVVREVMSADEAVKSFLYDFRILCKRKDGAKCDSGFKNILLSPIKNGPLGTFSLNQMIQYRNKRGSGERSVLVYGNTHYFVGDRVMMTITNYEKGYYNGDIGVIAGNENGGLLIQFDGRKIRLGIEDYYYMTLAYAVTIHKSQGSQFENVFIFLPEAAGNMTARRLLYTAVTRASVNVCIYSENGAFEKAVGNKAEKVRNTLLADTIRRCGERS